MILEVKNLSFSYKNTKVLENINFSLENGEFMGIIGPNGGGKSTLFKCILGLEKVSNNSIYINAKKLSFVPQIADLNAAFATSAMQVVLSGALNKSSLFFTPKSHKIKALKCLEMVSMQNAANANIHELSGGQRQRVLIARALMSECDLLLLDEPTASIDVAGQIEVFKLLDSLNKEHGISLLCVCHDLALISAYAKRILHVNKRAHFHEFCEHEKAARLAILQQNAEEFCEIEALSTKCELDHSHENSSHLRYKKADSRISFLEH